LETPVVSRRILSTAIGLSLASAGLAGPVRASEPKVVVTLKPVHSLVAQVMAGVGTPHLIVDGAASPHTFTLKPSAAKAISEADIFIRISDSLEPFTRKLAEALPPSVKLISLIEAPGVRALPQRRGETFEKHEHHEAGGADHDDDHDADEVGGKDGHIWLDPENAKAIVAATAKVLSETYPQSAEKFSANAAAVTTRLDALTSEIGTQMAPVKDQPFIVFHDSMQYFERRYGLAAAGAITITPDAQPSAKRLTAVRKKIADLGAVCVFAEPGFQPNLVAAVTEGSKAQAGTLDPEAVMLPAGPELYFELIRGLAGAMISCFTARN
jgi:zinc transport system substrate-binding protein